MSYNALARMAKSQGLRNRLVACAAQEDVEFPDQWVGSHLWKLVSDTSWVSAWTYAEDIMTVNNNPDIGARDDVISDGMILSVVQALITTQST